MFRVHTSIIRSIRCWVAAYGFLHRVFGWVVVFRAAALVMCTVRMVHGTKRTVHTTHAAVLKTTTNPKTRCRKPYAATQHLMLLMMGVCTRNVSSLVASSWHSTLFHEEDARSNNRQLHKSETPLQSLRVHINWRTLMTFSFWIIFLWWR